MNTDNLFGYTGWGFAAALLFMIVSGMNPQVPQATVEAITGVPGAGTFEYFPARYVNQATEVEPHIQAF